MAYLVWQEGLCQPISSNPGYKSLLYVSNIQEAVLMPARSIKGRLKQEYQSPHHKPTREQGPCGGASGEAPRRCFDT